MGCDYYIQVKLVIEYIEKDGKLCKVAINEELQKGYIFSYSDDDSEDDIEIQDEKYYNELEKRIKTNTNEKMLFENECWIKESYRTIYENDILTNVNNIHKLKRVYKEK